MRSFDVTAVTRLCANLQEIIDMLKEDYHITTAIHHIDGTNNTRADYLSRLVYNIPQLSIPTETHKTNYSRNSQLQLGHVHSIKDDHAIHNMTPSGPTTLGALVLIPEQQCCDPCLILTPNPQTANPNPPPEGTDAVRSVESFAPSVTTPEPTDGLCGICDMGEEDALDEIRDFYRTNGEEHSDLQLLGIPIEKVVKAAQGKISDQSAERLLGGTARGEQIEWTSDVLQFKDYYRGQQRARVLLPTKRLQTWALYHYHDDALTGSHRGASKCIEKISSAGFWWPNMSRETQQFTATCEMCQKGKVTSPTIAPVLLRRRSGARFANIQIDFIGPLGNEDRSPGNWQYMGVIIDQGTRAAMALPCWDMTVRSAIMCLLIWISTYGRPDSCQSDNGPAFASDEWSDFLDAYHIRKRFGTPGVPRHQGSVERVNREIKDAIHVGEAVRDERRMPWWATAILAIGVHNSSPLRDLPTSTPSELALGSDHATLLRGIEDASFTKDSPAETITLDRWQSLYEHINTIYGLYTHLRDERSVIEEYRSLLSAGQRDLTVFQPGDQVLLVGLNHKGSRVVIGEYSIISRAPHNRFMYYLEGLKGLYPTSRLVPRKINPIRAILDSEAKPQRSSLARALGSPPPESIRFPDLTAGDWLICEWRYAPRMTDDDSERPFWQYFVCEVSPHQRGLDRSTTIRVVGLDLSPRTNRWLLTKGKEKQIWQIKKDEFFVGFKPTKSRRIPASITKWLEARGSSPIERTPSTRRTSELTRPIVSRTEKMVSAVHKVPERREFQWLGEHCITLTDSGSTSTAISRVKSRRGMAILVLGESGVCGDFLGVTPAMVDTHLEDGIFIWFAHNDSMFDPANQRNANIVAM
ncbi:gag/pol/env polyprotein, putative [Perkinsus marinus ATCC 50983]|uniref:Gag/pol/env polyprotein, putative n=1 Tax=Perkinsus marinus (strain ATCC 50983 / TXsc) TaxID=423536 RepID=C5LPG5_PERM5|nr:gag/pol/env polyprotein, putative [Perkinsus marinus ATCC 50983]EER01374.1 gag/pol/env polyprotein, putative [Perkinsus marinus ATCC 50983]|eukprot:XP_002768656.1 gag/pol/env polyprotein, putative [Perkinsus marinus ATCC 50983]